MKPQIVRVDADWKEVKNLCRHTTNKESTDVPASNTFIKKILISEHSPIRIIKVRWTWKSIKSWIVTHFCRHHIGVEKWVGTQRTDRTGIDRDKSPQDTLVCFDMEANAQALINMGKVRLCRQASDETRVHMEDLKIELHNVLGLEEVSNVIVPQCIYRMGCSEFGSCDFFAKFIGWCKDEKGIDNFLSLTNIQHRYDLYNEYFYTVLRAE